MKLSKNELRQIVEEEYQKLQETKEENSDPPPWLLNPDPETGKLETMEDFSRRARQAEIDRRKRLKDKVARMTDTTPPSLRGMRGRRY